MLAGIEESRRASESGARRKRRKSYRNSRQTRGDARGRVTREGERKNRRFATKGGGSSTKARRGRAKRTSETETREQEVLGHKNRVNQRFGQERWRGGQWRRSGETRGRVAGETVERDE